MSKKRILEKKKEYKSKISANKSLVLKSAKGSFHNLIIITTTKKKEIEQEIISDLKHWMDNPNFDEIKNKKLDMAIVIFVDKFRMNRQDVDNIAKVVLDALKKSDKDPSKPYLFKDDSQVVRLLIYKLKTKEVRGYETNSLIISFREHDPNEQMILVGEEKCHLVM